MPRPRKYEKGYVIRGVVVPSEMLEVWETAKKVAEREGKTLSELVLEALVEYLNVHGAQNPQMSLQEVLNPVDELELACFKATLKSLISRAPRTEQAVRAYGQRWIAEVLRVLPRARRLMARSGDKELTEMVEQLSRMVKQMTGR